MIKKNKNLKELTFVVAPASEEVESLNFKKLVEYLGKKLKTSINLKYSKSFFNNRHTIEIYMNK